MTETTAPAVISLDELGALAEAYFAELDAADEADRIAAAVVAQAGG